MALWNFFIGYFGRWQDSNLWHFERMALLNFFGSLKLLHRLFRQMTYLTESRLETIFILPRICFILYSHLLGSMFKNHILNHIILHNSFWYNIVGGSMFKNHILNHIILHNSFWYNIVGDFLRIELETSHTQKDNHTT